MTIVITRRTLRNLVGNLLDHVRIGLRFEYPGRRHSTPLYLTDRLLKELRSKSRYQIMTRH